MRSLFLITVMMITVAVNAQITGPGSSAVRYTGYPSGPPQHPVFIFCGSGTSSGTLNAVSPGGTGPFTFDWTAWNNLDGDFTTPVKSDIDVYLSVADNLPEGGYRVRITDGGGYDNSLVAWVHIDNPHSFIALQQSLCNQVTLRSQAYADTFYYADAVTGVPLLLPNGVRFRYLSDPVSLIANPTLHSFVIDGFGYKVLNTPPLVDEWYRMEVTDSFGCVSETSFFYESIHVDAAFEVDPDQGEAPLEVFFTDKSVRALNYTWRFGDDTISNSPDPGSHIYYKPGEYSVILTIESDRGCIDSARYDKVVVDPSSLDIPNVFTPDGDRVNDFFVVESSSLRYLYVLVFSAAGKRVYFFEGKGEALRDWQGWDGKIGSGKASPGVYFYIIRAAGWDNVLYDGKEYRGFVYLYR
ncbi:MAG: gliding motility-associated C-terminal domain-containing protein [Bacteroidales bacterium]